jgi:hypothetical protein
MTDIRTLLDAATTGRAPTADPVGAVHARVRRTAARRRAGVAAGATVAVAAAGVAAGRPAQRSHRLAAAPTTSAAPTAPTTPTTDASDTPAVPSIWRRWPNPFVYKDPKTGTVRYDGSKADADAFDALQRLAGQHPDALLGVVQNGADNATGWIVSVALAADADPEQWRPAVAAAAGSLPWTFARCGRTAAQYEAVAAQVRAVRWPSGASLREPLYFTGSWEVAQDGQPAGPECGVTAVLDRTEPLDQADVAYARARWGADVLVHGGKPRPAAGTPSPNSDGTYG